MARKRKGGSKISETMLRRWADPEIRERYLKSLIGVKRSESARERIAEGAAKRVAAMKADPIKHAAFVERQRAALTARWSNVEKKKHAPCVICGAPVIKRQRTTCGKPECIEATKIAAGHSQKGRKGRALSEGEKLQRSIAMKKKWQSTEYREKVVVNAAAGCRTPEYRALKGAQSKAAWADPTKAVAWAEALVGNSYYARYPYTCRFGRELVFKSGDDWERGFARLLDECELTWAYEPKTFTLSNGKRYIPDFWIEEWQMFVELKASHRIAEKAQQMHLDGHAIIILQGTKAIKAFHAMLKR